MMIPAAQILIVDDEATIRLTIKALLTRDGHQVVTAESGHAALELINTHVFDIALIDLKLEDIEGTEVLAVLRKQSPETVVIMLTAHASLETAVEALRQGAHDYLFKPCQTVDLRESIRTGLLKRQQQVRERKLLGRLRRYFSDNFEDIQAVIDDQFDPATSTPIGEHTDEPLHPNSELVEPQQGRFLRQAELIVDFSRHVITLNGYLLELSPTEFGVLAYLISEAPRAISPQELMREVQGYESEQWEASETVRAHIYHIRKKIKAAGGKTSMIRTVRGVGYAIGG